MIWQRESSRVGALLVRIQQKYPAMNFNAPLDEATNEHI